MKNTKYVIALILAVLGLIFFGVYPVSHTFAEDINTQSIITGTSGTCPWEFDESTGTLTIESGTLATYIKHDNSFYGAIGQIQNGDFGPTSYLKIKTLNLKGKVYAPVDSSHLFEGVGMTQIQNFSNLDTSKVKIMVRMFMDTKIQNLDFSDFDTSKVTDFSAMFQESKFTSLDLSSFKTNKVTMMQQMFLLADQLKSVNLSSFDTSNVTFFGYMFKGTQLTSLDLSNFNTSNATSMYSMFTNVTGLASLDLSNFDTSNVTSMSEILTGTTGLTSLKLGNKFKFTADAGVIDKKWRNIGNGSLSNLLGNNIWTSDELITNYSGDRDADTYYVRGDITVNYVDEDGNVLENPKVISGAIDAPYDMTTPDYQLTIDGYSLDQTKLPANLTGTFSENTPVTITLVYKKALASLTVHFVSNDGITKIHDEMTYPEKVGDSYDVISSGYNIPIPGYTYIGHIKGDLSGILDTDKEVTLVYDKNELKFFKVPSTLEFEDSKIQSHTQEIRRKDPNWKIQVEDGRVGNAHWHVTAKLAEPFKDVSGNEPKQPILLFRKENQTDQFLDTTSNIEVFETTTQDNKSSYDVTWNKDNGLMLQVAPGVIKAGTYSGKINWTLEEAP